MDTTRPGVSGPSTLPPSESHVKAALATTKAELAAAAALVKARYAWRGYAVGTDDGASPPGMTMIAVEDTRTTGTLTLRADGPAGLAADDSYREVIDATRNCGRRVGELTRFAIDSAADWRPTLGALIGLAYAVGRAWYDLTDVFVEVNPRHERFYRRTFGFVGAAGRRMCPRVLAPAVLLRLELERLEAQFGEVGRGEVRSNGHRFPTAQGAGDFETH